MFLFLSLSLYVDIQEFYEVTLLNSQKSCEQKLVEVNHMAKQWEHTATSSTLPTEGPQPASTPPEVRRIKNHAHRPQLALLQTHAE